MMEGANYPDILKLAGLDADSIAATVSSLSDYDASAGTLRRVPTRTSAGARITAARNAVEIVNATKNPKILRFCIEDEV